MNLFRRIATDGMLSVFERRTFLSAYLDIDVTLQTSNCYAFGKSVLENALAIYRRFVCHWNTSSEAKVRSYRSPTNSVF